MGAFTPPELTGCSFATVDRTHNHDVFGLAVIVYQLLMGCHPFQVKATGNDDAPTIEDSIRRGAYPDVAPVQASPVSPPIDVLPASTRALFRAAFGSAVGGGTASGGRRPTAAEWAAELWSIERGLQRCALNINHHFAAHLTACPWCDRTAWLRGRDPFPSPEAIQSGAFLHSPSSRRRFWVVPRPRPQAPLPAGAVQRRRRAKS